MLWPGTCCLQINTLQQLENINSHSIVQAKLAKGKVKLHAFWFDIYTGEFFMFSRKQKHFIQVNENSIHDLMNEYCWTGPTKLWPLADLFGYN